MNQAEVEKIACYTRCTRHVVELVPLEHSSLRSSCSKPSRATIDCLVQLVYQYTIVTLLLVSQRLTYE
jgi:hypothetical protein